MGKAGSWLALGVSAESKGMKGVDIAMLRWTTVGGWVRGWVDLGCLSQPRAKG